jgi:hypothetical protein
VALPGAAASGGAKKRFTQLEDYEFVDLKTPFAAQRSTSVNSDLGIFFKEAYR